MLEKLINMFYFEDKEKIKETPIEFLHKAKIQRKKKQSNESQEYDDSESQNPRKRSLRTTESIISEKVKKYLNKIFGVTRFKDILEKATSMSATSSSIYKPHKNLNIKKTMSNISQEICEDPQGHMNKKLNKYSKTSKKISQPYQKSLLPKKIIKHVDESLNNLYNSQSNQSKLKKQYKKRKIKFKEEKKSPNITDISTNILKKLTSNSFFEIADNIIKKQKKKHPTRNAKTKKLKKTTKSSISTMCERAKLLMYDTYIKDIDNITDQSITDGQLSEDEQEEIIVIHDLNKFDTPKSSKECINICKTESQESRGFFSKCRSTTNNANKISNYSNIHHSSKVDLYMTDKDFETNLEVWTANYINGLVAVDNTENVATKISKIPVKKKSKSVKTKSKKFIKYDVNKLIKDDFRNTTEIECNTHLLGGIKTMEGHQDCVQKNSRKSNDNQKSKTKKSDVYMCQKVQDIQNYINNLILPDDVLNGHKTIQKYTELEAPCFTKCPPKSNSICPQKQSIQELKKFQKELKMRIKELEKNSLPLTKQKNTNIHSQQETFLNLSKFLNKNDNEPKMINKMQNCAKKNSFNLKTKFGDKFCDCFMDAKTLAKDICRRCQKKVYLVEKIFAGEGVYHNFCYTCYYCKRNLNSLNLCVTRGEIFCKQCFKKHFGPEMYGFDK